jgi:trehalose synthase-fused probable maltokinase
MLTIEADYLTGWLTEQRWFASKARELSAVNVLEALSLRQEPEPLVIALVEARFLAGTHELYQVVLGAHPADGHRDEEAIATQDGWAIYDALSEDGQARFLTALLGEGATVDGERGSLTFHWLGDAAAGALSPEATVRPMGAEQSNTSLVLADETVLKVFRRLEPGDNPELEMLRFLSARDFGNIAALEGWYEYSGELMDATLGVAQEFVPGARDGWDMVLDVLGEGGGEHLMGRLSELGRVTGRMHTVLGSDASDPDFAPEEPGMESLSLLAATIDEDIERVFVDLPHDLEDLEPIMGRAEDVRDRLQLMSHVGVGGRLIRHHGDFHLGQTLLAGDRWIILDFEGEPARSLRERRRKRSPLRDVAGMLRSFAYAASASELLRGVPAPEDWEDHARAAFLTGYYEDVDPSLLPAGQQAIDKLLSIFELEKAVYELRYELNNRPDWARIPVAGILRLLEAPLPT